jgi:deoxyribodipyrimidine photo-lyase
MTSTAAPGPTQGLVWFRRDLRLADNPAWAAATARHPRVTALYVIDDRLMAAGGPIRQAQLVAELHALDQGLRAHGGRLHVRRGDPVAVVPAVANQLGDEAGDHRGDTLDVPEGGAAVYWNDDVTPYATARDDAVRAALSKAPDTWYGTLVLPPGSVVTRGGTVHQVFGAFHRAWTAQRWDRWPEPGDATVADDPGEPLPAPDGLPEPPFAPGEEAAAEALGAFLSGPVERYRADRDRLDTAGGSALSVALRFGTISPRTVVDAAGTDDAERAAFVRQLAWRDWYAHLLAEHPDLPTRPLRREYGGIRWRRSVRDLDAWKEGRTGYPVVDAGMRQLASTGMMHNRVRMIAASFLVKDLLIDWRQGERHFRRLLVDGDVAQNAGNWQWVAGTGPDAAPYFRVFNPVTQSRTHDPDGTYLRRWLPELAGLDARSIHAPWEAGPLDLAAAGVVLGQDYPEPIVDHADARERALAAYRAAR